MENEFAKIRAIRVKENVCPARTGVAQVSKPAVSPISKSARRAITCGLRVGNPRYSRLGSLRYGGMTKIETNPVAENRINNSAERIVAENNLTQRRGKPQSCAESENKSLRFSAFLCVSAFRHQRRRGQHRRDESQRDSIIQPRVARNELPWDCDAMEYNPERVESMHARRRCNPVGVENYFGRLPRVVRCAANPGLNDAIPLGFHLTVNRAKGANEDFFISRVQRISRFEKHPCPSVFIRG